MSTFFENQIIAKKRTKYLLFLYLLAVFFIILGIYLLFAVTLNSGVYTGGLKTTNFYSKFGMLWNLDLFIKVSLGVSLIIAVASFFKSWQLGGSGANVATMLNGRLINPNTTITTEKQIINIVEEIAIASGMKVPPVYVMEQEESINAFAAGTRLDNAVIGISRGALETLTRDELQGVVAHEFSHILNGDMRLNLRIIGVLFGIMFIALAGRVIVRSSSSRGSRSNKSNGGSIVLIGVGLLIIGYTGVFFANLIKMAISRQREYLADASAVQYTRNPLGIAGALKKIGALAQGSQIDNGKAEEVSHMFFANGLRNSFTNLFSTHPPLAERIKILDPAFSGNFSDVRLDVSNQNVVSPQKSTKDPNSTNNKKSPLNPLLKNSGLNPIMKNPALEQILNNPTGTILGTVGTIGFANIEAARSLINNLPPKIYEAIHEPYLASLVIYLLILDSKPETRTKQLQYLEEVLPSKIFSDFSELLVVAKTLSSNDSLSILDLTLPTLNLLSESQFLQLRDITTYLAHADQDLNLLEYTLEIILLKNFNQKFAPKQLKNNSAKPLSSLIKPASELFLCLAVLGNKRELTLAEQAYSAAAKHCAIPSQYQFDFQNLPPIDFNLLSNSLQELTNSDYHIREVLLRACISCISIDRQITTEEFTLIRAIADSFNCPVPYLGA